jgi:hypothetical protein
LIGDVAVGQNKRKTFRQNQERMTHQKRKHKGAAQRMEAGFPRDPFRLAYPILIPNGPNAHDHVGAQL